MKKLTSLLLSALLLLAFIPVSFAAPNEGAYLELSKETVCVSDGTVTVSLYARNIDDLAAAKAIVTFDNALTFKGASVGDVQGQFAQSEVKKISDAESSVFIIWVGGTVTYSADVKIASFTFELPKSVNDVTTYTMHLTHEADSCFDLATDNVALYDVDGSVTVTAAPPAILSVGEVSVLNASATASVKVALAEVGKITSVKCFVTYPAALSLNEVTLSSAVNGNFQYSEHEENGVKTLIAVWVNGLEDFSGDFDLFNIVFGLPEGLEGGESYPITLGYGVEDCFDVNDVNVPIKVQNGQISVIKGTYGDANGDDKINAKDIASLMQTVSGWSSAEPSSPAADLAADVNKDGVVNSKDIALLMKYLAGWDVTIG